MTRPRLLDLFCKAGGCTKGYQRAGFHVTGVDIDPQPRYCGDAFVQADALEYVSRHGHEFDAISASPPCQHYSEATPVAHRGNHPDLIAPTRKALQAIGKPYVIENVENARHALIDPIMFCGSMFGLHFYRHRYFEIYQLPLLLLPPCNHRRGPVLAHIAGEYRTVQTPVLCTGGGDGKKANRKTHRPRQPVDEIRWAMDIPWMTQQELSNAIPPAYTEYIGRHLLEVLS